MEGCFGIKMANGKLATWISGDPKIWFGRDRAEVHFNSYPTLFEGAEVVPVDVISGQWSSEISALKARIAELEHYHADEMIETLKARLAASEAVEMLAALDKSRADIELAKWDEDGLHAGEGEETLEIIDKALSSDAGKKALEVIEAAEKAVKLREDQPPPYNFGVLCIEMEAADKRVRSALDRFHGRKPEGGA